MIRSINASIRGALALLLSTVVVLSIVTGSASAQSSDRTYVSDATGEEYTWSGGWELDDSITSSDDGTEVIGISSQDSSAIFSYYPTGIDLGEIRDLLVDELFADADDVVEIDRGADDDFSYSLHTANVDGDDVGLFTLFEQREDDVFVSLFGSTVDGFGDAFADAQSRIEIDGNAIFDGVDAEGLQDSLDGGAVASSDRDATPSANEDDDRSSRDDESTPKATDRSEDAELGLIGEGEYESPQFGVSVEWSDDWEINPLVDMPLISDEDTETDSVAISPVDSEDETNYGELTIRIFAAGDDDTPESIVEYWTSDDYLASDAGEGLEVLLSDSSRDEGGVVSTYTDDQGDLILYMSVIFVDRGATAIVIQFYATPDSVEDVLASAQENILVDGEPILNLFTGDEILDEYGA